MRDNRRVAKSDLLDLSVAALLERIASSPSQPGAGSASALVATMGAGLVTMTALASKECWTDAGAVAAQSESLRQRLTPLAEENQVAYSAALDALASRGSQAGGTGNRELGASLERAADVLARIAESAADVAELGASAAERGRPELRPDAATASLLGQAASRASVTLIEANLVTTEDDERLERARAVSGQARAAAERALAVVTSAS